MKLQLVLFYKTWMRINGHTKFVPVHLPSLHFAVMLLSSLKQPSNFEGYLETIDVQLKYGV